MNNPELPTHTTAMIHHATLQRLNRATGDVGFWMSLGDNNTHFDFYFDGETDLRLFIRDLAHRFDVLREDQGDGARRRTGTLA